MSTIKKCPIPIAGLILAVFSMGNVLFKFHPLVKTVSGFLGSILYIIFILRLVTDTKNVREELKNPMIASVFPTFTMATMLIATYIKPFSEILTNVFWYAGLIGHIICIILFTKSFVLKFDIKKVFPSWFIVYVGIVVGSISSQSVGRTDIGRILFYFGLVSYIILFFLILMRLSKYELPPPALPSLVIFAAPAALLLSGYLSCFENKNEPFLIVLFVVSVIMFLFGVIQILKQIGGKFIPSMSAFTFPMAINCVASGALNVYFKSVSKPLPLLGTVNNITIIFSIIVVGYVLINYIKLLLSKEKNN